MSNEQRMARVYFALGDTLLMMIIFGIIVQILKGWIAENGTDGLDGKTVQFLYDVERRVLSEHNLYQNTIGAVSTEPAFLSQGMNLAVGIKDIFTKNETIQRAFSMNIHAIKDFASKE